ncbi:hypothetical protein D3C75_1046830 [compost metagenome]
MHQRLAKGLQDFSSVVFRQPALSFGQHRLLDRHAVSSLYVLGQLATTEQLLTGIDHSTIEQHVERGHGVTDVDQRHDRALT